MSFDPILKFELKQHTPMIHFQHEQPGATLRGSELKPKFDKFLIKNVFKGDKNKYKYYLIPNNDSDKEAFDYKVKVIPNSNPEIFEIEEKKISSKGEEKKINFPLFFGNMGDNVKDKYFSFINGKITIEFFSLNSDLLKELKNNFPKFLMLTNFGTRNSKGFGSFYIDDNEFIEKNGLPYSFIVQKVSGDDFVNFRKLFEKIEIFYKSLRSGINLYKFDRKTKKLNHEFYFKSMMFLYAKSKGIQWDKKSIKEHFFRDKLDQQREKHRNSELLNYSSQKRYLVKELLGLSTVENWQSYSGATIERESDKSDKIERFPSPIFFKPINKGDHFIVFFDIKPLDDRIFDKLFKITKNSNKNRVLELRTPPKNLIDLHDFIKFAVSLDLDKHVEDGFKKHEYFGILKDIYSQVRASIEKNSKTNSSGGSNA